jgi:hypothetical protein
MARRIPRKPIRPHERPFSVSNFHGLIIIGLIPHSVAIESKYGAAGDGKRENFAGMTISGCR